MKPRLRLTNPHPVICPRTRRGRIGLWDRPATLVEASPRRGPHHFKKPVEIHGTAATITIPTAIEQR